ncbi:hypothetical protein [Methylobacterium planeticum]|uniref:Uncharacterized protein n=1 Tax=Methylobacterium planeticum TaxID=2615211 RepID=A0A6N6MFQ7_9HYPH|nr:hypothetical protein [Methylobacterium planeticum]KAB1068189.1 hypothetical protein F6X51_27150 [Methylobacterium planeticum]
MNAPRPPEQDTEAVEAAMLKLARAAAATEVRTFTRPPPAPNPAPATELGWLISYPTEMALMYGEFALMGHHARLVGPEEAGKARLRINKQIYDEFDRPTIEAGAKQ